ncbi:MAG: serine hydrolase domain-containing protein [Thermomicrobiales bacterium]
MFRAQVNEQRLYPGAALAVSVNGQVVLDLVIGYADTQRATPVDAESLFPMFSGSKPLGAVALWQQVEKGRLSLDDRVADHWPAFGSNGKDVVLVRHILCHRGGFPSTPESLPRAAWDHAQHVNRILGNAHAGNSPRRHQQLSLFTQHWVIGELIRIVDGRTYQSYLREEILNPLDSSRVISWFLPIWKSVASSFMPLMARTNGVSRSYARWTMIRSIARSCLVAAWYRPRPIWRASTPRSRSVALSMALNPPPRDG